MKSGRRGVKRGRRGETPERHDQCDGENFDERSSVSIAKRSRKVPVVSDEDEATVIEIVKNHPEPCGYRLPRTLTTQLSNQEVA